MWSTVPAEKVDVLIRLYTFGARVASNFGCMDHAMLTAYVALSQTPRTLIYINLAAYSSQHEIKCREMHEYQACI